MHRDTAPWLIIILVALAVAAVASALSRAQINGTMNNAPALPSRIPNDQ
jgi:hypothetical protein